MYLCAELLMKHIKSKGDNNGTETHKSFVGGGARRLVLVHSTMTQAPKIPLLNTPFPLFHFEALALLLTWQYCIVILGGVLLRLLLSHSMYS